MCCRPRPRGRLPWSHDPRARPSRQGPLLRTPRTWQADGDRPRWRRTRGARAGVTSRSVLRGVERPGRHVALRRGGRGDRPRVRDARLNLLLDSHVLVWFGAADRSLADEVATAIRDEANAATVSIASVWELELKRAKGTLTVPQDAGARLNTAGFELLDITLAHVVRAT